ncbi:hypothetical protein JCM8097_007898 [Rhodosporidiobolus ruineniae]
MERTLEANTAPTTPPTLSSPLASSSSSPPSSPHTDHPRPATPPLLSKRARVRQAVEDWDVETLRTLAKERGGFEDSELRRLAWPVLLRCDSKGKRRATDDDLSLKERLEALPARDDERQVRLDIVRSLVNYPDDVKDDEREPLRERLETAILTVLRRHPALQYFQGYHDIVSVLLLSLDDDELVIACAERLSLHHIRDNMGSGLEPTLGYLKLAHRLVRLVDPELSDVVGQAASMPFFALSWALTLLSHDLESVAVISRLFDFLLAHNPAMIAYLVVSILLTKKDDLLAVASTIGADDPAIIHSALSQLPHISLQSPSPPLTPTSPSPPPRSGKLAQNEAETDYEDEDLLSSSASLVSRSTSDLTDLTLSPTLSAYTSPTELSESLISVSEASPPPTSFGLRHRRGRGSVGSSGACAGRRTFALDDSFGSFDADIHALDDSMLADPDCDLGDYSTFSLPSSTSFTSLSPSSSHSRSRSRSRTPSPRRPPPAVGEVLRRPESPLGSPGQLPPPRTVTADELIARALELWETYPLVAPSSSPSTPPLSAGTDSPSSADSPPPASLRADEVLGPRSCIFTYALSQRGELTDEEAEAIVARGGEDVVRPGAAMPDPPEGEEEADAVEADEAPLAGGGRRRRTTAAAGGGRLNLGPHGWLVLAGAGVATAAVAYGMYRQGSAAGVGGHLGTAGVGLGAAGGAMGGEAAAQAEASAALAQRIKEGMEGRLV